MSGMVAVLCGTGCGRDGRTLDPPTAPLPATTLPVEAVPSDPTPPPPPPMSVIAPWPDGAAIPERHTCDGDAISPALSWTGVPAGALELALTVTDLDDPRSTLWILDALEPTRSGLVEGQVPDEGIERTNSYGVAGWEAPCPPAGETHRYQFTLHALNQQLEVADDASADEVISMLNAIAIDQASVSGVVARAGE